MRLRLGTHIFFALIAAGAIIAGSGYSLFAFFESDSDSTAVSPSPETIRENFTFNEEGDANPGDVKYYTVRFYSQYPGDSVDTGGTKHYTENGIQSEYSHLFGYFSSDESTRSDIENLNGEIFENADVNGTYWNCIEFKNLSFVTREILELVGEPICTDPNLSERGIPGGVYDKNFDPNKSVYYPLTFLSWMAFAETTDSIDPYYLNTGNRNDPKGWQTASGYDNVYVCAGNYPTGGYWVPNFNLSLSYYANLLGIGDGGTIEFYPFYSTGKNYTDQGNKTDALSVSISADLQDKISVPDTNFVRDPNLDITTESGDSLTAFRLSGFTVNTDSSEEEINLDGFTIQVDMYPSATSSSGWEGKWVSLADDLSCTYREFEKETVTGDAFSLGPLPTGRYNIYVFSKKSSYSEQHHFGWDRPDGWPDSVDECCSYIEKKLGNGCSIVSSDAAIASKIYDEKQIVPYKTFSCGLSMIISYGNSFAAFSDGYYVKSDVRDFVVILEKSFDTKLLGGEAKTFDYDIAPYSPVFDQVVNTSGSNGETASSILTNDYEAKDVVLDESSSAVYEVEGGKVIFPGTYFSVAIDNLSFETKHGLVNLLTKPLYYKEGDNIWGTKPKDKNGNDITDLPSVEAASVGGNMETEYYMSSSYINGSIDYGYSLVSLYDILNSTSGNTELNNMLSEIRFVSNDGADTTLLHLASSDSSKFSEIKDRLINLPILRAPDTGEYNLYLRFNYEGIDQGAVSKLNIEVYFYRLHNIFVKIASDPNNAGYPSDETSWGYITSSSGGFHTSDTSYFLLDTLDLADTFGGTPLWQIIYDMNSEVQSRYCYVLYDAVSGQYALPSVIENGGFVITKNHVLLWKYALKENVGWNESDDNALINAQTAQQGAQA